MGLRPASSFQAYFATLTDPRCPNATNGRHQLMDRFCQLVEADIVTRQTETLPPVLPVS